MSHRNQLAALALVVVLLVGVAAPVAAHETQTFDGYDVTFGGADEPLITGERMWLELEVVDNETGDPVEGQADNLELYVQTSGHERSEVNLSEKDGEDGVYEAPVVFTEPGDYVVHAEGQIEETEVHTHFETEVTDRADLEYPNDDSQNAAREDETHAHDDNETAEAGLGAVGPAMAAIGAVGGVGALLFRWR